MLLKPVVGFHFSSRLLPKTNSLPIIWLISFSLSAIRNYIDGLMQKRRTHRSYTSLCTKPSIYPLDLLFISPVQVPASGAGHEGTRCHPVSASLWEGLDRRATTSPQQRGICTAGHPQLSDILARSAHIIFMSLMCWNYLICWGKYVTPRTLDTSEWSWRYDNNDCILLFCEGGELAFVVNYLFELKQCLFD